MINNKITEDTIDNVINSIDEHLEFKMSQEENKKKGASVNSFLIIS
jgi:hypothetical protein